MTRLYTKWSNINTWVLFWIRTLSYKNFVMNQLRTAYFRTHQMARLNAYIDVHTAILLYKTYILPILEYGDILFAGVKKDLFKKKEKRPK